MDTVYKNKKLCIDKYWILFGFVIFVMFLKAFVGFDPTDESFYIALANRYVLGEFPITYDWHPACLSGILIAPFVTISRFLFGGTDYVILFCRLCYIVLAALISIYSFIILKKKIDKKYAFTIAAICLLYTKSSIINLSYNTLGTMFLLLTILLLQQCYNGDSNRIKYIIVGITLSIAVVSVPYFAVMCPIYIVFIYLNKQFQTKNIIFFLIGIIISVIIFFDYLFQGMSVLELIDSIPRVLSSSATHGLNRSFVAGFFNIIDIIVKSTGVYSLLFFIGILLYSIFSGSKRHNGIIFYIQSIVFMFNMVYATYNDVRILSYRSPGTYFIAISLFGAGLLPLISKIELLKYKTTLLLWYITGIIAGICLYFSSDTGNIAFYHGLIYAAIGALITMYIYFKENSFKYLEMLILVVVCAVSLTSRIIYTYRDYVTIENADLIQEGPAKGIITTAEKYDDYLQVYYDIKSNITNQEIVVFSEFLPWGYLVTDAGYGVYTEWRILLDNEIQYEYMEEMDRFPTVVFVMNNEIPYNEKENSPDIFLKYMEERGIEVNETIVDSGTIYRLSNLSRKDLL